MGGTRALLVDTEPGALARCVGVLGILSETEIIVEVEGKRAGERIANEQFDLLIFGACVPAEEREVLLRRARETGRNLPVLFLHGERETRDLVRTVGSSEKCPYPAHTIRGGPAAQSPAGAKGDQHEEGRDCPASDGSFGLAEMLGRSSLMQELFKKLMKVAAATPDVLITGETGTGKELVARAIHRLSRRQNRPFAVVNCGAIAESLMESELFGHERGAFTGAHSKRIGLIESANHGIFFLDEICELPSNLQPKLLRVLQERVIRPVGGTREIAVDFRCLAASSVDLWERVKAGRFSEALYYRIRQMHLEVPALRDRADDIPLLAAYFCDRQGRETGKGSATITPEAMDVLVNFSWPGNVRQLQNVIRSAVAMADNQMIDVDNLRAELPALLGDLPAVLGGYMAARERNRTAYEVDRLRRLMQAHKGDVAAAARESRLARWTLYRLLRKYRLRLSEFRACLA